MPSSKLYTTSWSYLSSEDLCLLWPLAWVWKVMTFRQWEVGLKSLLLVSPRHYSGEFVKEAILAVFLFSTAQCTSWPLQKLGRGIQGRVRVGQPRGRYCQVLPERCSDRGAALWRCLGGAGQLQCQHEEVGGAFISIWLFSEAPLCLRTGTASKLVAAFQPNRGQLVLGNPPKLNEQAIGLCGFFDYERRSRNACKFSVC